MAELLRKLRRWGSRSELAQQPADSESSDSCCYCAPDREGACCASWCDQEVLLYSSQTPEPPVAYCLIPPAILRET